MVSDWQVCEIAQPVPNARVSEGKGSAKLVIHIGDVTLNVRTPQGGVTRRVNHVFSGLHVGDYGAGVMADPALPKFVTTDLGLDRLWNRTITLLVLMGALAACIYGARLSLERNRRAASPPQVAITIPAAKCAVRRRRQSEPCPSGSVQSEYRICEGNLMRKGQLVLAAAAMLGLGSMAASVTPAEAGWRGGYGGYHGGYGYRGGFGGYRGVGFRRGYGGYGYRRGIGPGAAIGLGIAGLAAGAIAANSYGYGGYGYGRPVGYYGGYGYAPAYGYAPVYGGYGW